MQKKEIVQLSITGILIFVLIFVVIRAVKKTGHVRRLGIRETKFATFAKEEFAEKKSFQDKIPGGELFERLEEESKNLELKRDPFSGMPIVPEEVSSSGISLNGILWDEATPMALINDDIVKIGDRVGEYVVIEIKKDRVILNSGASDLELKL